MLVFHGTAPAIVDDRGISLPLNENWFFQARAWNDHVARVTLTSADGWPVDRSWMRVPMDDVRGDPPWEGIDRNAQPPEAVGTARLDGDRAILQTDGLRVSVTPSPLRCTVSVHNGSDYVPVVDDRHTSAYGFVPRLGAVRHYQVRSASDRHLGLGDKSGPVDHTGRRFRILQLDALGFDAEIGDPLYKHTPFLIIEDAETGLATGLFYDTLAEMAVDCGSERSNYHDFYRYIEIAEPALDLWVIGGKSVLEVVQRFTGLTGRPHLQPKWTLGFAFTTMHHADAEKGQEVITEFAHRMADKKIPLSAIHFGSGYSGHHGKRYVFRWNHDRYPDPEAMMETLHGLGLHIAANIKPVLLTDHPAYDHIASVGGFIHHTDGTPVVETFWGGPGSYLDFTNPTTRSWWRDHVISALHDRGIDAGWNDNNEFEILAEDAMAHGDGNPVPAPLTRAAQSLLMMRTTYEATRDRFPDRRPYTITRAGPPGQQRYGETWSGDNETSWHTLKWNLRQTHSMALSGMPWTGHDIAGFMGQKPDPELMIRWMQMMSLHPRCLMNSWKPDIGWATEPDQYPAAVPAIRAALTVRYQFLPVLYTAAWFAHQEGTPIIGPTFLHYSDAACKRDNDEYLIGDRILVAPVVTQGQRRRSVYLPISDAGWVGYWDGRTYPGGATVQVDAPLDQLPLFIRGGTLLPLAEPQATGAPHDWSVAHITAFMGRSDTATGVWFDDDGQSWGYRDGACRLIDWTAEVAGETFHLTATSRHGTWPVPENMIVRNRREILPMGEF